MPLQRALRPNLNIGGVLRLLLAGREDDRSPESFPERKEKPKEEGKKTKKNSFSNCEILTTSSSSPEINSPAVNWAPTQNVSFFFPLVFDNVFHIQYS